MILSGKYDFDGVYGTGANGRFDIPPINGDVSVNPDDKDEEWAPNYFRFLHWPYGKRYRGEDVDFVFRAKCLGYTVGFASWVDVGHRKNVDLSIFHSLVRKEVETRVEMSSHKTEIPDAVDIADVQEALEDCQPGSVEVRSGDGDGHA
jgi:hypothetical protein